MDEPENIMLSERSKAQKITFCMISFTWHIQKRQILRDKKVDEWLLGVGGMTANGQKESFEKELF